MRESFAKAGVGDRVRLTGKLTGDALVDAYQAMDVFAFSSKSETQGMVLVEAMAAGVPVVALDASGVRDVLSDGTNGFMVDEDSVEALSDALARYHDLPGEARSETCDAARATASRFSTRACADAALEVYAQAVAGHEPQVNAPTEELAKVLTAIEREWRLWSNRISAASASFDTSVDDEETG
jgi:glycosyltransferase involved in cell wall biosynthesis